MAHVLKLGFKQNPTIGVDDCIDFGGSGNSVSGSRRPGYYLQGYTEGPVRTDSYGRQVRDLTLGCSIQGASVADAFFKFTEINRYLQRTRMYFEHYNGNIPAQTDLQWHTGRAATLSFQAQGGSTMVFWDVLDGMATLPAKALDVDIVGFQLNGITIKITVNYVCRGTTVILENLLPTGDFEPPYVLTNDINNNFGRGWNATAGLTFDTTTYKYGSRSVKWSGANNDYIISPKAQGFSTTTTIVVCAWVKGAVTGAGGSFNLAYSVTGSAAVQFANFGGGTTIANWTKYTSSPFTVLSTDWVQFQAQAITSGGATTNMNLDGVAIFKNPTGNVAPTEYFTAGGSDFFPSANVYGIQGELEAPFILNLNHIPSSDAPQYFHLGMMPITPGVDFPLYGLDLQTAAGATDNAVPWRTQPVAVTGSPLSGTSTFPITGASIGHTISGRPRRYRAFLCYAAFISPSASATVTVTIGKDTKIYNIVLGSTPSMLAGTTSTIPQNYVWQDLGDFLYPRPGAVGIERTSTLSTSDSVAVTFTGGTNFFLGGVYLIPADQYIFIDLGSQQTLYNPIISNEGTALKVQLVSQPSGVSTYQPTGLLLELNSISPGASFTSDSIELEPGNTHFEFLMFASQATFSSASPTYWLGYYTSKLFPTLIYAPRYLTGAV